MSTKPAPLTNRGMVRKRVKVPSLLLTLKLARQRTACWSCKVSRAARRAQRAFASSRSNLKPRVSISIVPQSIRRLRRARRWNSCSEISRATTCPLRVMRTAPARSASRTIVDNFCRAWAIEYFFSTVGFKWQSDSYLRETR